MGLFDNLSTPSWISPIDEDKASWQTSQQFGQILTQSLATAKQNALLAPMRAAQINEVEAATKAQQLDIVTKQTMIDAAVEAKKGQAVMAGVIADISGANASPGGSQQDQMMGANGDAGDGPKWYSPETQKRLWEVARQYPAIISTPVWQQTWSNIHAATAADENLEIAQNRIDALQENARLMADTRKTVAETQATAKTDVADTNAQAKIDTAKSNQDIRITIQDMKDRASMARTEARLHKAGDNTAMTKDQAAAYHAELHNAFADTTTIGAQKAAAVDAVRAKYGVGLPNVAVTVSASEPMALPQSQDQLKTGQSYQLKQGVYKWNGKNFVK